MTLNKSLEYGIDQGSPDGDMTALTIRDSKKLFTFVGEEAEVIIALIQSELLKQREDIRKQLPEKGKGHNVDELCCDRCDLHAQITKILEEDK